MKAFIKECIVFIQTELLKRGFRKAVLGLSGGIDSAVVATLATLALGKNHIYALLMPSYSSNPSHFNDAISLSKHLEIDSKIVHLAPFEEPFLRAMDICVNGAKRDDMTKVQKLRLGNFCARIRMSLLYDYASAHNALVLGTSNKSEILLGYGTIFGDLACAINPIGELYKTEIFALARELDIPQYIIDKKPSADLFANQSDEADLGYTYQCIDEFLQIFVKKGGLEAHGTQRDDIKTALKTAGFPTQMIESLSVRIWANAFKRAMPTIFRFHNNAVCEPLHDIESNTESTSKGR